MSFNWNDIFSCFVILFTITDMVGNIPLIISMKKTGKIVNPSSVSIAVGVIFISFLFVGKSLLGLLHVDIQSFAVAGSIVIFIIALELILGIEIHKSDPKNNKASIVPIAFPLIAGPGSMTMLITLQADYKTENIIVGILMNVILIYILIKFSNIFGKYLSDGVLSVVKKIFGVILLAISIKIFGQYAPYIFQK